MPIYKIWLHGNQISGDNYNFLTKFGIWEKKQTNLYCILSCIILLMLKNTCTWCLPWCMWI